MIAGLVAAFMAELSAISSDKLGNKVPLIISIILTIIAIYPYVLMIEFGAASDNTMLIFIAQSLLAAVCYYGYGVLVRLYAGSFEARYRYSGSGLIFQIGAAYGSILSVILPLLGAKNQGIYLIIGIVIMSILSLIPVLFIKPYEEKDSTVI